MNNIVRIVAGITCAFAGIGLVSLQADRLFISLPPTTGLEHAVALMSSKVYEQEFVVHDSPVSRLGLYIRPLVETIPGNPITVEILHNAQVVDEQRISAVFASLDSATAIRLQQPLSVTIPDQLTLRVTVPPELSGKVALQTRVQDETFNKDAVFLVDGKPQPNPLAYEVYYSAPPAITLFVGALAILAGLLFTIRAFLPAARLQALYVAGAVVSANVPIFMHGIFSIPLLAIQLIILFSSLYMLRRTFALPAALLGAHTITFASWWSLVFVGSRTYFPTERIANLQEILADPNQVALTNPGAYVGMFVIALALVGFILWRQSAQWHTLQWIGAATVIAGIFVHPLLAAVGAAMLATVGVQSLLQFLGQQDRLVRCIVYVLVYFSLIEVLTVYSQILEKI